MTERQEPTALVTKGEAAEELRVSIRTIDRYIAAGELRRVKLSSRAVRIPRADVERLATQGIAA